MEGAADIARFGYILELLKRDKVGTARGRHPRDTAGLGGSARGERRLPSQMVCRVFLGEPEGRNGSSLQLMSSASV